MPQPSTNLEPWCTSCRVVLRGVSPLIWRRLLVRSDSTIADLHATFQLALGWSDEHLNRFVIHGREYFRPDRRSWLKSLCPSASPIHRSFAFQQSSQPWRRVGRAYSAAFHTPSHLEVAATNPYIRAPIKPMTTRLRQPMLPQTTEGALYTGERPRVVIADATQQLDGLRSCLEEPTEFSLLAVAATGVGAVQLVRDLRPDVLVVDMQLPDLSGVEVARRARAEHRSLAVVAITAGYYDAGPELLNEFGLDGLLAKSEPARTLAEGIRIAALVRARRDSHVSPGCAPVPEVSIREREVLRLVRANYRNFEIAAKLCIATRTVEFHLTKLMLKMAARSRWELMERDEL